jgi:hypothetical protein
MHGKWQRRPLFAQLGLDLAGLWADGTPPVLVRTTCTYGRTHSTNPPAEADYRLSMYVVRAISTYTYVYAHGTVHALSLGRSMLLDEMGEGQSNLLP